MTKTEAFFIYFFLFAFVAMCGWVMLETAEDYYTEQDTQQSKSGDELNVLIEQ